MEQKLTFDVFAKDQENKKPPIQLIKYKDIGRYLVIWQMIENH
jgi:hypothetical protein